MSQSHRALTCLLVACVCSVIQPAFAADPTAKSGPAVDLFEAIKQDQAEVKFIPANDREARLLITNKTKQPLSVKLPDGLVGVPVLAQQRRRTNNNNAGAGVGLGAGNNLGLGSGTASSQPLGGGANIGGVGAGGPGMVAFNIPPEKVAQARIAVVCLLHGAPTPTPQMPYTIMPVSEYTSDAKLQELIKAFASGGIDQRVAQAAAWHVANGKSWEELSRLEVRHLAQRSEPFFSRAELNVALQFDTRVTQIAQQRQPVVRSDESLETIVNR